MYRSHVITLAALFGLAFSTHTVFAKDNTDDSDRNVLLPFDEIKQSNTADQDPEEVRVLAQDARKNGGRRVASFQSNPTRSKYFSEDLEVSDRVKQFAESVGSVAFVSLKEKALDIGFFEYLAGRCTVSKYTKKGATLTPKSNSTFSSLFGQTKRVDKCNGSRSGTVLGIGEFAARAFGAHASARKVSVATPFDLYLSHTPTLMEMSSTDDLKDYARYLKTCLAQNAIDVTVQPREYLPLLVLSVKNDLFLESLDEDDWTFVKTHFNVTTLLDKGVRGFFSKQKDDFISAQTNNSKSPDLNSSIKREIFSHVEGKFGKFKKKDIIVGAFKKVFDGVFTKALPLAVGVFVLWFGGNMIRKASSALPEKINVWNMCKGKVHKFKYWVTH